MIRVRVKHSQTNVMTSGYKPQATFFVDDAFTKGLKTAMFLSIKSDGTADNNKEATITYAGSKSKAYTDIGETTITLPAKPALGLIYEATPVDMLGRRDNFTSEDRLLPKGRRQDFRIGLMTNGVIEVTDTSSAEQRYFRTYDYALSSVAPTAVDGTTNKTIIFAADLTNAIRAGDKITVKVGATTVVTLVKTAVYAAGTGTTITTVDGGYGVVATGLTVTVNGQIGEILYLADDMSGDLPFTTIKPTSGIVQPVGYIETAISARISVDPRDAVTI